MNLHPADKAFGFIHGYENTVLTVSADPLETLRDLLRARGVAQFGAKPGQRGKVATLSHPDMQRVRPTHGSQGNFRTSGFRLSFCAVMNSFASSVM